MPSRRSAMATLVLAGLGAACRGSSPRAAVSPSLDELAERYVRLTLRLAQHQPSLVETWLGHEGWRPGPRQPVASLRAAIEEARDALSTVDAGPAEQGRRRYLAGQFGGLLTAARRLSGETMRFGDEATAAFGLSDADLRRVTEGSGDLSLSEPDSVVRARAELERRLGGRGPLHERYATFRSRHAVPRVGSAFRAALAVCRDRVIQHIQLPDGEGVEVTESVGLGLEARALYAGDYRTSVAISVSGPTDLARIVWLAAHETYPGHHVQHLLADAHLIRSRGWVERQLHVSFGPHLFAAEGVAEAGAQVLLSEGAFEEVCRKVAKAADVRGGSIGDLVAVHRAVTDLDLVIPQIAQAYLDGSLGTEAATERLTGGALVADARAFLMAIERQRTRLLAYPMGRRLVAAQLAGNPPESQWERLRDIAMFLTL